MKCPYSEGEVLEVLAVIFAGVTGVCFACFVHAVFKQLAERRRRKVADELSEVKRASSPPVNEENVFYVMWGSSAFIFMVTYFFTYSLAFSSITAFTGIFIPDIYVKLWKKKRCRRLEELLPDVLSTISSGLRAGRSLQTAVELASKSFPEPARSEFTLVALQLKIGATPEEAFKEMAGRLESREVMLLSAAVDAARRGGGNLAHIIEKLAHSIRKRIEIEGRIRTLSSQGRAQAWVMASLPGVMLIFLYYLDPEMLRSAFSHPVGIFLMLLAGVLEGAGIFIMRRIINVEV